MQGAKDPSVLKMAIDKGNPAIVKCFVDDKENASKFSPKFWNGSYGVHYRKRSIKSKLKKRGWVLVVGSPSLFVLPGF